MTDKDTRLALLEQAHETSSTSLAEVRDDVKEMRRELAALPGQLTTAVRNECVTRQEFKAVKTVAGVVALFISTLVGAISHIFGK